VHDTGNAYITVRTKVLRQADFVRTRVCSAYVSKRADKRGLQFFLAVDLLRPKLFGVFFSKKVWSSLD
jgi:hypothetical protein